MPHPTAKAKDNGVINDSDTLTVEFHSIEDLLWGQ
jgi:hypothetical protein